MLFRSQNVLLIETRWPRSIESTSPATPLEQARWFRLFRVRSPLLTESLLISFPPGTKMFQFPGCATVSYVFRYGFPSYRWKGCPIRKSPDQSLVDSSPRLIAASYVLHRSLQSRHPHHTLCNLHFSLLSANALEILKL